MLVALFNAVKVESVPLNSDEFCQPTASPLTIRFITAPAFLTCLVMILGARNVEGRFAHGT
jgi:hypothetical protein